MHGVMFVGVTVGLFGLLPRLGGLTHDAAGLRHARPAFVGTAIVARGASLACYALSYRRVLASLGARLGFRLAAGVVMATFLISHVTPSGSATGTIPITPGGLGVIEVTLVAITVGFGAPRATAVLAVLGYRVVNYWLPLPAGALAYLRPRLRPNPAGNG